MATCPECGRSDVAVIRKHHPKNDLGMPKWGRFACPGSGAAVGPDREEVLFRIIGDSLAEVAEAETTEGRAVLGRLYDVMDRLWTDRVVDATRS